MLLIVFLISGVSGLMYQILWVRAFASIFGNTIHSSAIVSGIMIFMLGIGSLLGGFLIDRRQGQRLERLGLKYYIAVEISIGLLGYAVQRIIPIVESLSVHLTNYQQTVDGFYHLSPESYAGRYLVAMILISLPSLLMGATLSFLARYVLSASVEDAGLKVGLLYAFNTLGAAIGCLVTDLLLIPNFGLAKTYGIAVSGNLLAAGLGAVYGRFSQRLFPKQSLQLAARHSDPSAPWSRVFSILALVLISGFVGLGIEVV